MVGGIQRPSGTAADRPRIPLRHQLRAGPEHPRGVENSYWRLEYLNWSLTEPGDVFLGAPAGEFRAAGKLSADRGSGPNGLNSNAFPVITALGTRNAFGFVPDLSDANFDNQNGIKGTFGVNFEPFTFEGSVWALDQENCRP